MTNEAKRNEDTVEPLVRLLLRWYYGYHRAIEAHKADSGNAAIKPHFLAVYRETDNLLGAMRQAGTITDQQCHETYEQANPARSGLSADAQGSDCAKGAKDG